MEIQDLNVGVFQDGMGANRGRDGTEPGLFFQKTRALLRLRSGSKFVKYLTKNRRMRCFLQNIPGSAPVCQIAGSLPVAWLRKLGLVLYNTT